MLFRSSVTPRIRRDEPLLRILAEREAGQILSLRHPCLDRAISNFIRIRCFEEECGSFIIFFFFFFSVSSFLSMSNNVAEIGETSKTSLKRRLTVCLSVLWMLVLLRQPLFCTGLLMSLFVRCNNSSY